MNFRYLKSVIYKSLFGAKLQSPINKRSNFKNTYPLVITYYSNFHMQSGIKSKSQNIKQNTSKSINEMFGEMLSISSLKQLPNLVKLLLLNTKTPQLPQGLFTFKGKNCELCAFNTKPCMPTSKH